MESTDKRTKKWVKLNQDYLKWIEDSKGFSKWLDDTTIHGAVHVFKSRSILRRVLWTLVFVGAVIGCLYTIGDQIRRYAGFPTSTTITLTRNREGLEFPAVTLCNFNIAQKTIAEMIEVEDAIADLQNVDYRGCLFNDHRSNQTLRDVLFEARQPLDEFVKECFFIGFVEGNDTVINCSFVPSITDAGYCYTFNGDVNATKLFIRNIGSNYGLHLTLNINQSEYLQSTTEAGVRVAVHNRGESPEVENNGIAVPPQRSAFIGLRPRKIIDTSTKKTCGDKCLTFFQNYSLSSCRLNHYYYSIARNCGCIATVNDTQILHTVSSCNDNMANLGNLQNCSVSDTCCIIDQLIENDPSDSCPSPCSYKAFDTSSSYSSVLSNKAVRKLAERTNTSLSQAKDDIVVIKIFFAELSLHTITTQDSFPFTALLSSIGGNLGLFLGASIISIIELVWFLIDDILEALCCKSKCVSKNIKSDDIV